MLTESSTFTFGSHKDDVIRLQGTPTSVMVYSALGKEIWDYGLSSVEFDRSTDTVVQWNNFEGNLKVESIPPALQQDPTPTVTPTPTPPPVPQAARDWTTYTNRDDRYSLSLPPDWAVVEVTEESVTIEPDEYAGLYILTTVRSDRTLDEVVDEWLDFRRSQAKAIFEMVSRSPVILESGLAGTRIEYRHRADSEYCIEHRIETLILQGSQVFDLLGVVCEGRLEQYRADIVAMQNTFDIVAATPSPTPTPTYKPSPTPTPLVPAGGTYGCSSTVESRIDDEFEGFESDRIYVLRNGQVWQQTSYEYAYRYRYAPRVTISPSGGRCVMEVEGMSRTVYVVQVEVTKSRISGEFNGLDYGRTYTLQNGQVWQQKEFYIWYRYSYAPTVIIYKSHTDSWMMKVEGITRAVRVERIR